LQARTRARILDAERFRVTTYRVSSRTLGEVHVDAVHWLTALGTGLAKLGALDALHRIAAETLPNGRVLVRDVRTGVGFVVQPLDTVTADDEAPADLALDGEETDAEVEPAVLADELFEIRHAATHRAAIETAIDAALAHIPAEAGSVLLVRGETLAFVVSRGPGCETLVNVSFPRHVGVAGFCVDHGTAVALLEARTDARFFGGVDDATGVRTRSLLCSPVVHGDHVFGCIELINAPAGFDRHALACADALGAALGERLARG
jgi:hypothetical protein